MSDEAVEIITGKARRRWSIEAKLRIVAETEEPGTCIKAVAARHGVCACVLSNWRRQAREGRFDKTGATGFMPVRLLASSPETTTPSAPRTASDASNAAGIEITLPDGTRLHIRHAAQLPLLRPVIAVLRG